jgi:ankyrin repeat protein
MKRWTFIITVAALTMVAPFAAAQTAPAAGTASDKAEALSEAVRKGDAVAVRKLLDEGADVNTKYRYDRTPLSFAADRGHVAVVKLLLERGANVNAQDTFYHATPLVWAISPALKRTTDHTEVVRLIVEHGGIAESDMTDALEAAIAMKLTDVVPILEKAGAKRKEKK